jgi:threonine dehydratase
LEAEVFFKCENFQKIGAFKMRGATYATLMLSAEERAKGIVTHSSGNHAQAVALSAQKHGIPAYIVMPKDAPAAKRAATKGYGATIIDSEPDIDSRYKNTQRVLKETGGTFIPPFNDYNVIAGQGTAAKELIEAVGDLDVMTAPIGGGGLMSGMAIVTKHLLPNALVLGTEPYEVDDAYRSIQSGKIEKNPTINTMADGLRTTLGEKTFEIIREKVDEIIRVEEADILAAMRMIWERMKIVVEPSSAVPLAALMVHKERFKGKRIGLIITGGNVDVSKLPF